MNNISLKKALICGYNVMPSTEALANNSIIVVTSAGIIVGDPVCDEEPDNTVDLLAKLNDNIVDNYYKESNISDDKPMPGNDGFFTLKNASLISGSLRNNLGFINIFYDQVVAISIGNIK